MGIGCTERDFCLQDCYTTAKFSSKKPATNIQHIELRNICKKVYSVTYWSTALNQSNDLNIISVDSKTPSYHHE